MRSFWSNGWVLKTPLYFFIGGHDLERRDAWIVWWAEVHPCLRPMSAKSMLRLFLPLLDVAYHKPYISFARPLKGRNHLQYFLTDRLLRLSKD